MARKMTRREYEDSRNVDDTTFDDLGIHGIGVDDDYRAWREELRKEVIEDAVNLATETAENFLKELEIKEYDKKKVRKIAEDWFEKYGELDDIDIYCEAISILNTTVKCYLMTLK